MNKIYYTLLLLGSIFFTVSCVNDLDQYPNIETTSADVYTSVDNYKAVLGKIYVSYVITGQEKGGGNSDLNSNSGYDYMRCYFNMQVFGTDEAIYTWQEGDKMNGLTYLSWDANDVWVSDTYYRIYYTIALCNEFLRNAEEEHIEKFSESDREEIRRYRAEARFLRALSYYHALDLFRDIPFVTENDPVGSYLPPRYTADQVFEYIESELKEVETELLDRTTVEYGRASKEAAWALMARLYLNAEVYTGAARWTDCIDYCNKIIAAGYTLEDDYTKLFNAENDKRTNEIIYAFPVDATYTASWGATTYIICGAISNTSDSQLPADYGVESGWGSFRLRGNFPDLFSSGDGRALFYTEGQTKEVEVVDDQGYGYLSEKWTNLTDAGERPSNFSDFSVNTDFPVFRLADVYLMLAEAVVKGGEGSSRGIALGYVNQLRERAFGDNSGNITDGQMTADFILDERARELYWECTRRTDLVRYDKFTTADYLWEWKGGVKEGKAVDSKYNIYPIPSTDLTANPNLWNENY